MMKKITIGQLCKPNVGHIKLDDDRLIDYFDIASIDNINKKITGFTTYTFVEAPSRARRMIKKDNILVSTIRPNLNAVALFDMNTQNVPVASTGFCVLDCKEDTNPRFLFYYLQSRFFVNEMVSQATGASYPAVSDKIVRNAHIPVYSYDEQVVIADMLDKVTYIIVKRKQQLAKLDELVKARFVEMFGDVIHNDKKWKEYRFSDITSSRLGKMLDAKQQTGKHSFPYLANANVQWFRFETDNLNRMDFNEAEQVEFSLKDGDLLVCEGGEIGRCAVWHNQVQSCYFQKALHRVRCNQEIILPDYLAWWFKFNCENNGFAAIEGAKATIAHLPGAKLKQLLVVVPPIERQYRFVDFIEQTDVVKVTVQKSLEQMETLKKALMQQYFG